MGLEQLIQKLANEQGPEQIAQREGEWRMRVARAKAEKEAAKEEPVNYVAPGYVAAYLGGRVRTATDRAGTLYHAVPAREDGVGGVNWGTALCGRKPQGRSFGWSEVDGRAEGYGRGEVTCPRCLAKLAKMEREQ